MSDKDTEAREKGLQLVARIEQLCANNEGFRQWIQAGIDDIEAGRTMTFGGDMGEQSPDALAIQKQLHEVLRRHLLEYQRESEEAGNAIEAIYAEAKAKTIRRVEKEMGINLNE